MTEPDPRPAILRAVERAVERAAAHRRALHRADPRYAHYSDGAFEEQVVGVGASPSAAARNATAGGWLPVGTVVDGVANAELGVWLHPATDRVRVERHAPRPPDAPPRPDPNAPYFSGERMRWIDPGKDGG